MSKTVSVQARMEPELKAEAEAIMASLGLNATTAITLFYTQMVRQRGIPFELKVPKEELATAMRELKDPAFRKKAKKYSSVSAFMDDLSR